MRTWNESRGTAGTPGEFFEMCLPICGVHVVLLSRFCGRRTTVQRRQYSMENSLRLSRGLGDCLVSDFEEKYAGARTARTVLCKHGCRLCRRTARRSHRFLREGMPGLTLFTPVEGYLRAAQQYKVSIP